MPIRGKECAFFAHGRLCFVYLPLIVFMRPGHLPESNIVIIRPSKQITTGEYTTKQEGKDKRNYNGYP